MNVAEHNTFIEELVGSIQKSIDNVNTLQKDFDTCTDLDELEKLRLAIAALSEQELDEALANIRNKASDNSERIKELELELAGRALIRDSYTKYVRSYGLDKDTSEKLLNSVNDRIKKVTFDKSVDALTKEAETFEEALASRVNKYLAKIEENSFFIEKVTTSVDVICERLLNGKHNQGQFSKLQLDCRAARSEYDAIIRELCEAKVQGITLQVAKVSSRYDAIDKLLDTHYLSVFK
jgi:hypothetical protein